VPELTADMFVSLDGFAAGPGRGQGFTAGYDGPEFTRLVQQVLDEPQVIVMGRVTYQDMSGYWPSAAGPIAAAMNTHPKLVFSRTLSEPLTWNSARLATRDPAAEITALKQEPGPPLRAIGSLTLVKEMMALGLVDRLRLLVFPRILGTAGSQPMFGGYHDTRLRLAGTTVIDSEILMLEYRHPSHVPA
jgi:dihydrofolate reductase